MAGAEGVRVGGEREEVEGQRGRWAGDTVAIGSLDVNGHDVCPEGSQWG